MRLRRMLAITLKPYSRTKKSLHFWRIYNANKRICSNMRIETNRKSSNLIRIYSLIRPFGYSHNTTTAKVVVPLPPPPPSPPEALKARVSKQESFRYEKVQVRARSIPLLGL